MTFRFRSAIYVLMMLLVSAVIVGVYFDRPRDDGPVAPAAAADDNIAAPDNGPVTDAKLEAVNQA